MFRRQTTAFNQHYSGSIMSNQDLQAELERLRAENAALKQRGPASIKVSEKAQARSGKIKRNPDVSDYG
jgi:hypothetical protein